VGRGGQGNIREIADPVVGNASYGKRLPGWLGNAGGGAALPVPDVSGAGSPAA
jgi:hypothetical protein